MNDLQRPEDEHFFFRHEMRCKSVLEGWSDRKFIHLYGLISDYRYSVVRPANGLALNVAIDWGFLGIYLRCVKSSENPVIEGLGLSIANTLPFLGFIRRFHGDIYKDAPNWLEVITATQSTGGIILLFFLGLGLRNRFRLK